MTSTTRAGFVADHDDIAMSLARTAMDLFLEHGFANVTVEGVAKAAGVSRRTVFRYFASKDELPFPDHARRRAVVNEIFEEPGRGVDPVGDIVDATTWVLQDFLSSPDFVLHRYTLTRTEPQLAQQEVLENEAYVVMTRRHLRNHLPSGSRPYEAMAIAAFLDGVHRSALSNWVRSGGKTDALAELTTGMEWARRAIGAAHDDAATTSLLAVIPNTPTTRKHLQALTELDPRPEP